MTSCETADLTVDGDGKHPGTAPGPTARLGSVVAAAAVAFTVTAWASSFVVIRSVGEELSAGPMALLRVAVACAVLTPFAVRGPRPLVPRDRNLVRVVAYGVLWFAAYNVFLNEAERHVDAATAALLVNVAPLLIAVGAGVLLREGFPRLLFGGCLVALAGIAVMSLGAQTGGHDNETLGLLLGLAAATVYAGSVLLQKVVLRDLDAVRAIWLGCLFGTLALLPFGPALLAELPGADPAAVGGAIYLGVVSTAVAFSTWAFALRRMPAGRIGPLVGYLVTVVAVLMSWAFLAEVPSATVLVGGAICLTGVAISQLRRRRTATDGS